MPRQPRATTSASCSAIRRGAATDRDDAETRGNACLKRQSRDNSNRRRRSARGCSHISAPAPYIPNTGVTPRRQIAITRQSPQRKELRIPMISQVKHPREPRGGVAILSPEAVLSLRTSANRQFPSPRRGVSSRPPPSTLARPMPFATMCWGKVRNPGSRACS